tara:strand:+ start:34 stop:438 length:405 start_codon:yes stop_codon:yes gene_type:complete
MHPRGARKNKLAQAIFSNDGPNLNNPEVTKRPKVIPKRYKAKSKNKSGKPSLNTETPKRGIAIIAAGTMPIRARNIAVKVRDVIISLIFIGAINKFVKFLLQISSKNIMLKLILTLNKKSYKIAAVSIIPTVSL